MAAASSLRVKRWVRARSLKGIHSLFHLDEVSLLAVPDAVHRHWDRTPPPVDPPLPAPRLDEISAVDTRGRRTLSWSFVPGVKEYVVQQSPSAAFERPLITRIMRPSRLELAEADMADPEPDRLPELF